MSSLDSEPVADKAEARCYFVRGRNALAVRAQVSPVYVDYYLHLAQYDIALAPEHDRMLKEGLAAMLLHLASRPWNEKHAWTINFQEPLLNLFATGDNRTAQLAGRIFTGNVKRGTQPVMYSQLQTPHIPLRQSVVELENGETNLFRCVERFYRQSEQRTGRFFFHDPEDIVFITAQPRCDVPWLEGLTDESIKTLDTDEELSLLETRSYQWGCGCNVERLCGALAPHAREGLEDLFAGQPNLNATCPRCGAAYTITREQFEAWLEAKEAEDRLPSEQA